MRSVTQMPSQTQDLAVVQARLHGLEALVPQSTKEALMYLAISKGPRKANRNKTKRYRSKLKAKDKNRRGRVYQIGRK
jgi:hypothetical protein